MPAHAWNGVADSDFRFGLGVNKAMAAAGRREVRDLVTVHETILSPGAVVWAAVEKSPGFTPEGLIAEIRRSANYPAAEWRALGKHGTDRSEAGYDAAPRLSRRRGGLRGAPCPPRNWGPIGKLPDPRRTETRSMANEQRNHRPNSAIARSTTSPHSPGRVCRKSLIEEYQGVSSRSIIQRQSEA